MPKLTADNVEDILRKGDSARLPDKVSAKFEPGQQVVVRNLNPLGHTRAPRYIRGKTGIIDRDHGVMIFPDTHAAGTGKSPQHVYSVRFEAAEVWGPDSMFPGRRGAIYIDLWDDYLDRA